jgi:Rrf2 family protein
MRITARCDYACKALLELALHWPQKEPLQIHAISERQNIPMKYLVHILIQLKRLGLVKSARGKEGGYNLAKPVDQITLGAVVRQIGGPLVPLAESAANDGSIFTEVWHEAEMAISDIVDNITFAEIVNKKRGIEKIANYQI